MAKKVAKSVSPNPPRDSVAAVCIFLVAIIWLVFGRTLGFSFTNYDDPVYIYQNPDVAAGLTIHDLVWTFSHVHSSNWHPLTFISHMADCQLFGLNAGGHHFTSVLLHTVATLLLFFVLRDMTGGPNRPGNVWASAFVAALFAIHPLRVESVAWLAERKDVLSAVFFMLTLGAYVRYTRDASPARYAAVALFFALGLMSKPMLVTVPLVLLLLDYWPLQRIRGLDVKGRKPDRQSKMAPRQSFSRLVVEKIPLLVLAATSCLITLFAQGRAVTSFKRFPLTARVSNALASYIVYIGQMFWPARLSPFYPYAKDQVLLWEGICACLVLIIITAAAWALRKKHPYLVTGWLWYLGMLVPAIGLIQVGMQAHADRYTYLPQIGLFLALTWLAVDLSKSWPHRKQMLAAAATSVIAALAWCAWIQTSYWRNSETLWTRAIEVDSDDAVAFNGLGSAFFIQGSMDKAITNFNRAIEIFPDYEQAHSGLGAALRQKGQFDDAVAQFQKAVDLRPGDAGAYNSLGHALLQEGLIDEAIAQFQKALELVSDTGIRAGIHYNLATALRRKGRPDEAIAQYQKAIEINPSYEEAHYSLGDVFQEKDRVEDSIIEYQKALQLRPNYPEAHVSLGNMYLKKQQPDEAIAHYRKALELKPAFAQAHNNLGNALRLKGEFAEAIEQYQETISLDPRDVAAENNLAWILATCSNVSLRDGARAVDFASQADRLSPNNAILLHTLAAAYAQNRQFPEAIQTAQRALQLASAQGNAQLSEALRHEIALYQSGSPYDEKAQ